MRTAQRSSKPWLRHYDDGVPPKIDYAQSVFPQVLAKNIEDFPERMALCFQGYCLSYAQLGEMIDRFAAALVSFGIGRGDRVAILLPNLIPCVAAYQAVLKLGAVVVMNNPLYTDRELTHQFNDSGAPRHRQGRYGLHQGLVFGQRAHTAGGDQ